MSCIVKAVYAARLTLIIKMRGKTMRTVYFERFCVNFGLLLIVLLGFLAHSMTFDSLKYPHLNWVFHSFLGLLVQGKRIKQGISSGTLTNRL